MSIDKGHIGGDAVAHHEHWGVVDDWAGWVLLPGRKSTRDDAYLIRPGLVAVADGVDSGAGSGQAALDAIDDHLGKWPTGARLRATLHAANWSIWSEGKHQGQLAAAVAVTVVEEDCVVTAYSGDVRAFLLRGRTIRLLTVDHVIDGTSSSHRLGQAPSPKIDLLFTPLDSGDRLILCSDGLWRDVWPAALLDLAGDCQVGHAAERIAYYAGPRVRGEATAVIVDLDAAQLARS